MLLQDAVVNQRHLEKVVRSLYPNEDIFNGRQDRRGGEDIRMRYN